MIYSVYKPHTHAVSNSQTCTWDANILPDAVRLGTFMHPRSTSLSWSTQNKSSLLSSYESTAQALWMTCFEMVQLSGAEFVLEPSVLTFLTLLLHWNLLRDFVKTMPTFQALCSLLVWSHGNSASFTCPLGDAGIAQMKKPWTIALCDTVLDFKRLELYLQICHHPSTVSVSPLKAVDKCI